MRIIRRKFALSLLSIFLIPAAHAQQQDEDMYKRWLELDKLFKESQLKKPAFLELPPIKQTDDLSSVQSKYVTLQGQKFVEATKDNNAAIKAVDNFSKHPPSVEVMSIKNSMSYELGSSKAVMKSEYGDLTLKESYTLIHPSKEIEMSELVDKGCNFRLGIKFTEQPLPNDDRTLFFFEKQF